MKYLFTPQRIAQLESMITEAREKADQAARSGYESSAGQDGHHDEGYQLSLQQTAMLDRRLRDLIDVRRNAEIVIPVEQDQQVQFGNGVELVYSNGNLSRFVVEGYVFGSSKNSFSLHSPLGRAIVGAKRGDEVSFNVDDRIITVVVKKIFFPSQAERFCFDDS